MSVDLRKITVKALRYKNLFFDFDGVLAETNDIRTEGFEILFAGYERPQLERLMSFVRSNGGISRYGKFKYFFEEIRHETISPEKIQSLSAAYTSIVKQKVIEAPAVEGSLEFLNAYKEDYNLAIVSGSDQKELREICQKRRIAHFFKEILGSPVSKEEHIQYLLAKYRWNKEDCVYIGDSSNDYQAAQAVPVDFIGRNSGMTNWQEMGSVLNFDNFFQLDESLAYQLTE